MNSLELVEKYDWLTMEWPMFHCVLMYYLCDKIFPLEFLVSAISEILVELLSIHFHSGSMLEHALSN